MKTKFILFVLATLVASSAKFADDSVTKAAQLSKKIEAEQNLLAELQTQLREKADVAGTVYVRLGGDFKNAVLYGAAAGYLLSTSNYDTSFLGFQVPHLNAWNPLVALANKFDAWQTQGGALVGWLPKEVVRQVGYYGAHAVNITLIGTSALASAVDTAYVADDAVVLGINHVQVAALEARIQTIQEYLSNYLADLKAIQQTN